MDSSDEEWDLSGEEMDPADEEPELPSAVQELIQKLEDKAKPLRRLLRLSSPDLQEFFPEHASLSTIIGWRRKVRLRVLEAFGSCNTFHSLDVDIVFGGDISRLLGWEWEILLRGFRSSTILRAIRVRELRWNSPEEVESLCKELGEILKNSSVEVLTIVNCRLSATCFLNLESGLRESDKSKLESLELHNAWKPGYSDAVHQVVHMINSATRLETLEIGRSGGDMYNMDENDKKILSQALIKNSSLKKLVLNEVKGQASAFLLRAFDARYGNEAIECLHLTFMSGLGDCLGELLRSNPYLKEVTLTAIDLLPEKWHQLGKAISENATARTIRVIHSMDYKDSFTEKGVEDFACGASFDVKVPTVELIITFKNYDALMSALDFVGRVLRGNIKSLESLILILECSCPSGSNHDIKKSKVPMDGNPGETSVLKRLKLFVKSRDTLKGVWKYLLCCLRENTSVTHLDLCNSGLDDEAFRELMGMLQVNLTLQQIDVSRTVWANEGKSAKIEELLKQNQERAAYMSVFREAELTFGDAKAGQLFLCGSPRAGKTRLRRTLMKIIQSSSKVRNFPTKFVEKFVRKSERISDSMQISIWDFVTPQHEIFPQTSNFCIFQFVYSPFCQRTSSIKPDNCFLEELKKCIRFITSHTRYSPPQVLVVMSHKDKVKDKSFTWANTIVDEVTTSFTNVVKLNQEWFHVDAREQKQVLPVKDHIFNILKVFLTENSPRVPHLCSKLTSCLVTQTKKGKCPVWSSKEFHDFCDPILRKFNPTPSVDHSRIIRSIISYMNDVGSIIYIPNVEYIIVDPNWLTHTLLSDLGQHFQAQKTESFDGSSCDTSKDGYVSESVFVRWTEEFLRKQPHGQKGVNREMLENILINLLLCDKLEDTSEYFLACFIRENPSMEKQRPEEGKAEEEDGKDEDGEGENEKEDGEVEDEEDASSSSSSCDEDGEDSFQCIITSFDSKRASMEEQKHKEGAHESMYGQNMDDTSQVVGIRIQSQNEDGEDDGKDEEDDEKDGEGDEKDGEGEDDGKDEEDDGKDGEGDGKDGEGDEKDEEGEDDGKGEDEGEDEHGVEGEDEEEDGKDEDEEGGGEDEDDESIYFSCEEDEDGEGGGKNEEDTSIFFFCEEDDGEDEEDESIFFSCEEDDGERENEEGKDEEEDGEDTSQHVIPSFDSKRASMEKQKHEERGHQSMDWYNRDDNSQFVGIRIQCQDERTMSLTAAFFLRFQMFMRRKLISEIDVSKESVTCSRQYLRLFLDGHQIYVQQGRNHEYVDVLMLCSKRKKELARRYMMKHIVGELISFCASTNGCPGVALVLGVIQTLCVEMLNPSHLREAILIEKLKSDFIRSINDKLEEMTLESSHLVKKEELFNYEHRWAPYESGISERARDLLWQSDVEAVVNCIRQKQIQKLESLQEGLNSVDSDLAQSSWLSQASTMKDYKPSTSKWLSQESTSVENRSTGIVLRLDIHILDMEMQRLEMKEMKIGETLSLQRLEMMEMKMEQILSLQREYLLQQELQTKHSEMTTAMLSAINSEVDKRPRGKNSSYLTREQTIKAAGVSIVSDDAAELATRGMDSEDEEPGLLPSEVDKRPRGKNSSYLTREQTIKAADVSIVSDDAAELATRGMDSEDEEPGLLPSAAKDLIWRLEGRAQPLPWLSTLSSPEFQEFFPEPASLSTIKGWRGEVRLRVLEAIGSCNTFHSLDVQDIFGGDISRLTASEWELLLRGFRRSTVLRAIRVEGLRWSSLAEVENLCLQLGRILNASSVKDLRIVNCRLNARCFLNLASGLLHRSMSELESLELRDAWEDSSAVKHMADMIIGATRLETLEIGGSGGRLYDMDEEATRTLSQALMRSWSLKKLVLKEVKDEASAFLLKALNADDGNRTIECLHLISVSGLGDCLRQILRSKTYVKEVTLTAFDMRPEEGRQLGEAIRENATARTIRVTHSIRHKDDFKGVEELACAASSTNKDPRMEMIITFYDYNAYMSALNFVVRVLRGNIKSVESLILILECSCPSGSNQDRMESIVPMDGNLGETSVLKRLRLYVDSKDNLKGVWKYLLCCLRENTSVTHLDLCNSGLDDEAFKELMGVLQVNLTLKQIDVSGTSWAIDGKATLIQMALEQNQKRGVYMAVFREARLAFGDAKAGRIFLCGSPLAGKTQLRQTLMRIVQGKSWLKGKLAELFKTTGIEVEFLQNNEDKQISIWDVPGQEIFRTLQNVLFPRTSNFSLFLFVYSTFCEKTFSSKPDHCLQSELEDWLNLITSCTRVTGHNLPQVLVVISHKDKATSTSLSWAHDRMEYLTKRFANFVDVLPIQECSYIDARKKNQVVPLKNHIFHIFEKLLSEKSPRVPKLCFQLSSLLVTNTKEHITCPIWTYQRFCDFCAPSLKKLIPSSSPHSVDHSSIIRSIILYLNEVGSIVHIPNLDYIIVNPNWLTNTLLGELIGLDQKSKSSDRNRSYTSTNGFVSESIFARLIEEFLKKQPHVEKIVDRHVLENILINLDLCFKLEDSSQYFIPSFIPEGSMAWHSRVKSSQFVGIRIQCQDARTMSFTAGFFPCFQMFMRSKLISEMHVPKKIVTCSRHYLCTILDGHEIYVEQGTSYKYVDVLMLCSKYKSRKTALKYVMKHIIQELISFCASPKGCSEVALERSVIQTLCVERLYPSHLRQAILVETLKSDFIHSINDKLEEMPLGSLHLTEEELLSYEHFWPLIEGHISEYTSERATELLCESDVEAVVNEIRQKQMQRLESLQKGLFSVENDLAQFCKPSTSRRLSGSSKSVENRSTQLISFELDQIRGGLDEILRSSASIELRDGMEMTRGQILSRHQELQSTLSAFISKVDRIIEYSTAPVNTRTPKRPYVTNDVGLFYKMSAHLDNGTIIRLHLMCESVSGFHTVEDQEGLRIRLDSENRSWIQKIIEISYKVIYYAVKSGLHKTYNLGQAIPDGEDLEPAIVTLDGIDHREFRTGGESKELQEAWLRIQQILAPQLKDRYSKIFNLYEVKYLNLEVAGHAWVCEKCLNKGLRSRSLEV